MQFSKASISFNSYTQRATTIAATKRSAIVVIIPVEANLYKQITELTDTLLSR